MGDIAKRAGVQRATVYNHFPTDMELIDACSSHWFSENPPPDPTAWTEIQDPKERAVTALTDLYQYYESGRDMLGNVLRDIPQVPALEEIIRQKWLPMMDGIVAILEAGWKVADGSTSGGTAQPGPTAALQGLRATIRIAIDFFVWQTLSDAGLSNQQAARLAAQWIEAGSQAGD
jgi:AcrR family transcriptional regulator